MNFEETGASHDERAKIQRIIMVPDKAYDRFRAAFLQSYRFAQHGRRGDGYHVFTAEMPEKAFEQMKHNAGALFKGKKFLKRLAVSEDE